MSLPPDKIEELRIQFQTEAGVRKYFQDIRDSASDTIRRLEMKKKTADEEGIRWIDQSLINISQLGFIYDILEVLALNQIEKQKVPK